MNRAQNGIAVSLDSVTKRFGEHTAVASLDLEIPAGSIYGLLGPNGSGKTTTIRMIIGILGPDAGNVSLLGGVPDPATRRRVGYLPEERGLYRKMKVLDILVFLAEIRGVARATATKRARRWLARLELEEWAGSRVEDLSKGMQQKVQFIGTVLHEPELLILDEPFSGLDPINQDLLEEIVREFHDRGTTILFSTHLMEQAERLCDSVCLISHAAKVLDGDLAAIKRAEARGVVHVLFDGPSDWVEGPEVLRVAPVDGGVHILLEPEADAQPILERGVSAGARIRHFERVEPSLHEIFVKHAGREEAEIARATRSMSEGVPA